MKPITKEDIIHITNYLVHMFEQGEGSYRELFQKLHEEYKSLPIVLVFLEHSFKKIKTMCFDGSAYENKEEFQDRLLMLANYAIIGVACIRKEFEE